MRSTYLQILYCIVFIAPTTLFAQHKSRLFVEVDAESKKLNIQQEIHFVNDSEDTLTSIVLNDWNNAYSNKNSPLAHRFSDEFYRGFHLAKESERGSTDNITIIDDHKLFLAWERPEDTPDVIRIKLRKKLAPKASLNMHLTYSAKIPSDKFTKFGYDDLGSMNLKSWYLTPAQYENHNFITYNNVNLDDIANAVSDFNIEIKIPNNLVITSDLDNEGEIVDGDYNTYSLTGKNRKDFSLFLEPKSSFYSFKNGSLEVITNLQEDKISTKHQAEIIDCIVNFTNELIGKYPFDKIIISRTDYERNPFYGLNQLPSIIRPFSDEFTYEIKFLKTYLNTYLKNSLRLDPRKDNWVYDAIQMYAIMQYVDKNHPNSKMLGNASTFKLLKSFNLTNIDFNEQFSYFYMLMARKNLDQPLNTPKNKLVKFNEQIAGKYRAGLSLRYLDSYLENNSVSKSIHQFYEANLTKQQNGNDFENILKSNTTKNIDWFYKTIINSRDIIDYKLSDITKTKDSVSFTLINKTEVIAPIPVYGIKKGEIVFEKWLFPKAKESAYSIETHGADKIVLNYKNEVPEYNLRNNWKSLKGFFPNNRPVKFVFMKDLEDPKYNQLLYVPTLTYNLYDGLTFGARLHNKTILEKPFIFDTNPSYSTKAKTFSGSGFFVITENFREALLKNIKYSLSGSYFHYAPDATYTKINPMVQLNIRNPDFRDNRKQAILLRQVIVNREKSEIVIDNSEKNYSVFNLKYINSKTEVTKHFSISTDLQLSSKFGKMATEFEYRKLFENNHQINLRFYGGRFLYNNTYTNFFNFALDRPTDYLFDYNYYGRSESSGFFSQQLIVSEGGFKSKLNTPYANQWITTMNASYNLWNWIELYGDAGFLKNKLTDPKFVYDCGIRLNLVTDYFEMYLPVYSNNGWEISQNNYNEKIRFIITLSPKILINIFNRKWF